MQLPKMSGTVAGLAMGAAAVAGGGAMPAFGDIVYDVNLITDRPAPLETATYSENVEAGRDLYPNNSFIQQRGNGFTQYGDNVQLGAGAPKLLQNIVIPFVAAVYDLGETYPSTYTANLSVNVYAVDANGLPTGAPLGNVTQSETFNTYLYTTSRPGVYAATEYVTFDFSSQNIVLPNEFAFAYSDISATAVGTAELATQNSFSVWAEQNDSSDAFDSTQASGADTPRRFLQDASGTWTLVPRESQNTAFPSIEYNIVAEVNAIPVPEPTSAVLLAAGGLMLARRRRA